MTRCAGCLQTMNLLSGADSPVPLLWLRLPPPKGRRCCRTCCMGKNDIRVQRMMPACHRRPAPAQGTEATASVAESSTPGDTERQRSTGDLHNVYSCVSVLKQQQQQTTTTSNSVLWSLPDTG